MALGQSSNTVGFGGIKKTTTQVLFYCFAWMCVSPLTYWPLGTFDNTLFYFIMFFSRMGVYMFVCTGTCPHTCVNVLVEAGEQVPQSFSTSLI